MSTQCTLLIMLCASIPQPRRSGEDDASYEPLYEGSYGPPKKGLAICYDGMCGNYCYAGYTLLKSKELMSQNFEFHHNPGYVTHMANPTLQQVIEVKNLIKEKLGVTVPLKEIAVRMIFHYS